MSIMKLFKRNWRTRLPPALEEGAVTAEFAVVLPSVIALAGLLLALGRVVNVSMTCQNAAAEGAREYVVTGDTASAQVAAINVAGGSATVEVSESDDAVRVAVTCSVLPGPMNITPIAVHGSAVAVRQQ